MLALSAVSGITQIGAAQRNAAASRSAANEQLALQNQELLRQQGMVDDQAAQQKGDRARQADRDNSTLIVMAGERGLSANAESRAVQELGYFEGMDLDRIEQARTNRQNAISLQSQGATLAADQAIRTADNIERTTTTNAFLGTLGSGLQIGADYYKQQRYEEILRGGGRVRG
jgi:hypothetical protein